MMKVKRILILIGICLLLFPSLTLNADVIIEPENEFYEEYKSEIIYLGRSFIANGKDGFAAVREAPGAKSETGRLQNGEKTYFQYSCLYDGDYWGYSLVLQGWIQTDQLLVLYDYVAFEEEHFNELYLYKGDYGKIKETRSAIAWPWPGADAPLWTIEDIDTEHFNVDYAYTDSQGREWGFVTNFTSSRNIWVCLSEPLNSDFPAFNPKPEPTKWVTETKHTDINAPGDSMLWLIVVLVAAVVVGTAVLIRVFWKPKKIEQAGERK